MSSIRIAIALAAWVALPPMSSGADEGGNPLRSPVAYLGVSGVSTHNAIVEEQLEEAFGIDAEVENSAGVSAVIGYRVLPFLATELEYEYVDGFDVSLANVHITTVRSHTVTGNLKWILPLWRVQPYALTGVGMVRYEFEHDFGDVFSEGDTALAYRLGLGVDVHLTPTLLINSGADVVLTNARVNIHNPLVDDVESLSYLTIRAGLQYRFWTPGL